MRKESVTCKYVFNEEELKNIACNMAQKQREKKELEDEKKSVMSGYANKLKVIKAHLNSDSTKYSTGYEMRGVDCEILYDYEMDLKIWRRIDTGEIVQDCKIPDREKQVEFEEPVDGEIADKEEK